MTLMVFLGVLVSLLILRSIPGLLLRLILALPRQHLIAIMRWMHALKIGIAVPQRSMAPFSDTPLMARSAHSGGHFKLVVVSSSLLVLAVLVSTAFWTWHSSGLMMLLR